MADEADELARRAIKIAAAVSRADFAERAAARRMGDSGAPVFWRQVARLGITPPQEGDWRRFTRLIALLTSTSAKKSIHNDARPLGAALAESEFSEQRLARLLAARGEARAEALERAIRVIARRRPSLDVVSLARFALGGDGDRLARDYYSKLDRSSPKEPRNA